MHLFYTPDINGKNYTLDETESRHCIRVLRLKKGDTIYLVDGCGGFYKALINNQDLKSCTLDIIEAQQHYEQRPYYLHVAMAPTKNTERLEWFLEKAVEIGIDEFTPLICERSERKTINIGRLEKIAIAAMKQSIKAYKPKINQCISYDTFIKSVSQKTKMIAYCGEFADEPSNHSNLGSKGLSERIMIDKIYRKGESAICLIGPEGDFSQPEIKSALDAGFAGVSFGQSRLRVETAGLYVCVTVYNLNAIYQ